MIRMYSGAHSAAQDQGLIFSPTVEKRRQNIPYSKTNNAGHNENILTVLEILHVLLFLPFFSRPSYISDTRVLPY